jgi:hypothetical protein
LIKTARQRALSNGARQRIVAKARASPRNKLRGN